MFPLITKLITPRGLIMLRLLARRTRMTVGEVADRAPATDHQGRIAPGGSDRDSTESVLFIKVKGFSCLRVVVFLGCAAPGPKMMVSELQGRRGVCPLFGRADKQWEPNPTGGGDALYF